MPEKKKLSSKEKKRENPQHSKINWKHLIRSAKKKWIDANIISPDPLSTFILSFILLFLECVMRQLCVCLCVCLRVCEAKENWKTNHFHSAICFPRAWQAKKSDCKIAAHQSVYACVKSKVICCCFSYICTACHVNAPRTSKKRTRWNHNHRDQRVHIFRSLKCTQLLWSSVAVVLSTLIHSLI